MLTNKSILGDEYKKYLDLYRKISKERESNMNIENKFFITKQKLDYRKLIKKIKEYYDERGMKPYLFMNSATIKAMDDDYCHNGLCEVKNGMVCRTYHDNKIFCDESLQFGEVEIR